jgi:type IV pilus assembly protein PilW
MNVTVAGSSRNGGHGVAARGFTLVELMVAVVLGILVSIGLVSVFGATSKTNRIQDALSQLQENGRYAVNRMTYDLRLESRQLMNGSGFVANAPGANGVVSPVLAPQVYVSTISFPDGDVGKPTTWDPGNTMSWWPLSPRYFMQGYECSGACTVPVGPATPATGTTVNSRVQTADVLAVRYLNTHGWSSYNGEVATTCSGANLASITLTPVTAAPVNSPASNFLANDLALMTYSNGAAYIFKVSVAGNVLTPTGILNGGTIGGCSATGAGPEVTIFNFSRNFITATYALKLLADNNNAARLIPTLVRQESDATGATVTGKNAPAQEIVQGVEQMDFLYGVQAADGTSRYLTASDVQASTLVTCPPPPSQYVQFIPGTMEPDGCLWRAVKTIEVHLLLDSVNDMYDLTANEMAYLYKAPETGSTGYAYTGTVAVPANQAGGIPFGRMMRREFVSLVSIRNFNP